MILVNKKLQKLGLNALVFLALLFVGHSIAQAYSSAYNSQFNQVSKLLSEYFDTTYTNSTGTTTSIGELLSFKEKPPRSGMSKQDVVDWNMETLREFIDLPVDEPRVENLVRKPADPSKYDRANATLVALVRNKELAQVRSTIYQIEGKFNSKFNYPYVFLNDGPFTEHFKESIKDLLPNREVYFETIDPNIWNRPDTINPKTEKKGTDFLTAEGISYADQLSYHNMCRYYSGNFYNHPRLQQFRWYWRFEPGTNYFCDIDYDLFKFMEDNNKTYGFTIALYDAHQTVKSLWTTTLKFLKQNPQYLNLNGAFKFLTENLMNPEKTMFTQGYSTCHFWSNFEIGDMDFFRLDLYNNWFKYLDESGGFYYERWGDAPVHSIGLSLFEDKSKLHWFRDIGYEHNPYVNCPNSNKCSIKKKGERKVRGVAQCEVGRFSYPHLYDQNCISNWIRYEMDDEAKDVYRV